MRPKRPFTRSGNKKSGEGISRHRLVEFSFRVCLAGATMSRPSIQAA